MIGLETPAWDACMVLDGKTVTFLHCNLFGAAGLNFHKFAGEGAIKAQGPDRAQYRAAQGRDPLGRRAPA